MAQNIATSCDTPRLVGLEKDGYLWSPSDDRRVQRFRMRLQKMTQVWINSIKQMEEYEIGFAQRLSVCISQSDAISECNFWAKHRMDTIRSMHAQLFELWVEMKPRIYDDHRELRDQAKEARTLYES